MSLALYLRVSTSQQTHSQTIEQQLERLETYCQSQGWSWPPAHIFRDDDFSGASLNRPGLDRLRDGAAQAKFSHLLITAPDRLARKYVHQVLLIEELESKGCQVHFVERPMSQDPHDQLLLQIRGAVAEYERSLIADRTRRGRFARFVGGSLLPWTRPPYGYRVNPDKPGDPGGVTLEPTEAAIVTEMFAYYLEEGHTLWGLTKHLTDLGISTSQGHNCWRKGTVRTILTNPVYTGKLYVGRYRSQAPKGRRSPLKAVGLRSISSRRAAKEDWILVNQIAAIVSEEQFELVQTKLIDNQAKASRNNKTHQYLLRALVSCGECRLACNGRTSGKYSYYGCLGSKRIAESGLDKKCSARSIQANQLDEVVWRDLCQVVQDPQVIKQALQRAQGGEWLPQELQARRLNLAKAKGSLERQLERLTEAYLAEVVGLEEYKRRRKDVEARLASLVEQVRQLETQVGTRLELAGLTKSVEEFCSRVATSLGQATFSQKRHLVELLIDRVVVTKEEVEIHYVVPTSSQSEHIHFCHLRLNYAYIITGLG